MQAERSPQVQWHTDRYFILSIVVWVFFLAVGQHLPLVADEAYYLAWSHQIALGYFDHPPMVAYLISLAGSNPRLAAWLTTTVSVIILTLAARRIAPSKWTMLPPLFVLTPLGLTGSLIMTPDIPLLLAVSITLFGLIDKHRGITWLGLTMGLWSKPMALLMRQEVD